MTYQDFDNFRLILFDRSGDLTWKMGQKIENDVRSASMNIPAWKQDLYMIYSLNRYIDILLEYTPFTLAQKDTNFFDRNTMKNIQYKINAILDMDWNLDFILS